VIAGIPVVKEVFCQLDRRVKVQAMKTDGRQVRRGDMLVRITGPAAPIIIGERTALNFLGMLSGIATITAQYVKVLRGTKTRVFDTRKTPPGLRGLVKYAVSAGGGCNHRMGLYDAVLIKDNHIASAGSLGSERL
jgi:nicotinate-nucleotide pyrophosphorylase (carboxylating)